MSRTIFATGSEHQAPAAQRPALIGQGDSHPAAGQMPTCGPGR